MIPHFFISPFLVAQFTFVFRAAWALAEISVACAVDPVVCGWAQRLLLDFALSITSRQHYLVQIAFWWPWCAEAWVPFQGSLRAFTTVVPHSLHLCTDSCNSETSTRGSIQYGVCFALTRWSGLLIFKLSIEENHGSLAHSLSPLNSLFCVISLDLVRVIF